MFTSLLFLVLILMTVSLSPDVLVDVGAPEALAMGLLAYGAVLMIIVAQTLITRRRLLLLVNVELFAFFLLFHLLFASHTLMWEAVPSQTLLALVSLGLYFFALWVFELILDRRTAWAQIRFLLPFTIPFLIFDLIIDGLSLVPYEIESPGLELFVSAALAVLLLGFLVLFFPFFIQKAWGCVPMQKGPLRDRLEALCERAKFRHSGMLTWPVMAHAHTAGILGVLRQFRYVMFTDALLRDLTPWEIEAVLAHEIGHARHKHLLFYPLIILGMIVVMSLYSVTLGEIFENPLAIYLPYAAIVALYFRYVFGFFSRLFERQADLHVFALDMPAQQMIDALDRVATLSGGVHDRPSWHHYSIAKRIDFLRRCVAEPQRVKRHHRKVVLGISVYLVLLLCGIMGTVILEVMG